MALGSCTTFQSPSFRGGSTPGEEFSDDERVTSSLNPLRFGAGALPEYNLQTGLSSGSVSIPFVSGREHSPDEQRRRLAHKEAVQRFNPLRFGAGALPQGLLLWSRASRWCFNPLRFGAGALPDSRFSSSNRVVAKWCVSIPFVSGREHSLRKTFIGKSFSRRVFQSPSFRGGSTPGVARKTSCGFNVCVSIPFVSGREHSRRTQTTTWMRV